MPALDRFKTLSYPLSIKQPHPTDPAIDKQPPAAPGAAAAAAAAATGAGGVPYDGPTRSIGANSFPPPVNEEEDEGGYYHYLMTRIDEVRCASGFGLGRTDGIYGRGSAGLMDARTKALIAIVLCYFMNRRCWARRRSRSSCGGSRRSKSAASRPVRACVHRFLGGWMYTDTSPTN